MQLKGGNKGNPRQFAYNEFFNLQVELSQLSRTFQRLRTQVLKC